MYPARGECGASLGRATDQRDIISCFQICCVQRICMLCAEVALVDHIFLATPLPLEQSKS